MTDASTTAATATAAAAQTPPARKQGPLRWLYNTVLKLAESPRAEPWLFVIAFAESSCFPIPPDVMLAPMCFAKPSRAMRYAIVCAVGSVLGSILGWSIGFYLGESVGRWILSIFGLMGRFEAFKAVSNQYAVYWILAQGLIPVPYKLVTIACGMLNIPLLVLVLCSAVTRTTRFSAVAFVCKTFGPQLAPVIEKRIGLFMALAALLLVGAIVALAMLH